MHSILPETRGIMVTGGSDRIQSELAQKNAGLWIQYSALSIGCSCGTGLLDNGGLATVPAGVTENRRNTAGPVQGETTEGVIS